jgi:hypothetical protein
MYEDVYGELEKVRRLLLSEHGMNTKMREQVWKLNYGHLQVSVKKMLIADASDGSRK